LPECFFVRFALPLCRRSFFPFNRFLFGLRLQGSHLCLVGSLFRRLLGYECFQRFLGFRFRLCISLGSRTLCGLCQLAFTLFRQDAFALPLKFRRVYFSFGTGRCAAHGKCQYTH